MQFLTRLRLVFFFFFLVVSYLFLSSSFFLPYFLRSYLLSSFSNGSHRLFNFAFSIPTSILLYPTFFLPTFITASSCSSPNHVFYTPIPVVTHSCIPPFPYTPIPVLTHPCTVYPFCIFSPLYSHSAALFVLYTMNQDLYLSYIFVQSRLQAIASEKNNAQFVHG